MMGKARSLAIGVVGAAFFSGAVAHAEVKLFWDQGQQKFVSYDVQATKQRLRAGSTGVASRNYTPIPRQTVSYDGPYGPDTIIINTSERRLYYVFEDGKAYKYGIGVGREGFQWAGTDHISRKAEWPGWTPPPQMIKREAAKGRKLPAYMPGGINNPLGARALYIGSRLFRIHGSNEPWTIGGAVSSGCIRMVNDDVIDLYEKVDVGTRVVVLL
jgi:lipoprotein-anchoring transpeptidase ErfK/SrfK